MSRIRRILFPTDFSLTSTAAHQHAVEMAKAYDADLFILHVLGASALPGLAQGTPRRPMGRPQDAERSVQAALDFLVDRTQKAGARSTSLLLTGDLHDQVLEAARSRKPDIVVLGVTLPMARDLRWPDLANQLAKAHVQLALVSMPRIAPDPDFMLPLSLRLALPGIPMNPPPVPKPKTGKGKPTARP